MENLRFQKRTEAGADNRLAFDLYQGIIAFLAKIVNIALHIGKVFREKTKFIIFSRRELQERAQTYISLCSFLYNIKFNRSGFFASKLTAVKLRIKAIFGQQIFVTPLFHHFSVPHDKNYICFPDGGKPVGHHNAGSAFHHFVEGILNFQLCPGIDR